MEVDAADFYRDPDPQVCQGDIIADVPHLYFSPPIRVLRPVIAAKHGQVLKPYGLDDPPEDGLRFQQGRPEDVAVNCLLARGILLTHGCEIDKDTKHRTIALVRPLTEIPPEAAQTIRNQQNLRFSYLPALPGVLEESYVDFRRLSCIAPELISAEKRLLSLTVTGLKQFLIKYFMYVTRAKLESLDAILGSRQDVAE